MPVSRARLRLWSPYSLLYGRSPPWSAVASRREEGTMTTPTPAETGRRSKEPAVAEIDGFRGRLITADHGDYDTARAIWTGAIYRRPRLLARCLGSADLDSSAERLVGQKCFSPVNVR